MSPYDRGVQAERTALAWRRTALAVALGSVAAGKVLAPAVGPTALGVVVLGLAWSVDLARVSRRRHAAAVRALAGDCGEVAGAVVRRTAVLLVVGSVALGALTALAA